MPAALLPLLALTCGSSANADISVPPRWPGLPPATAPNGWNVRSTGGDWSDGLSEATRAQQWLKIPAQAEAFQEFAAPETTFPADDSEGRLVSQTITASLALSSPKGAKYGYGIGIPATVHTVAFGAVPIQVRVQLEQVRDANNLPVPLQLVAPILTYKADQQVRPGVLSKVRSDLAITGHVRVRLTALAVDGVDVGLSDCVSAPIDLDLKSVTIWTGDPDTDPNAAPAVQGSQPGSLAQTNWMAARGIGSVNGGAVTGDVDIPAFSHCVTKSGEDLSPLLTDAISGPDNPVTVGYGSLTPPTPEQACETKTSIFPYYTARGPFSGDPSDCDPEFGPPTLDYPKRGD